MTLPLEIMRSIENERKETELKSFRYSKLICSLIYACCFIRHDKLYNFLKYLFRTFIAHMRKFNTNIWVKSIMRTCRITSSIFSMLFLCMLHERLLELYYYTTYILRI